MIKANQEKHFFVLLIILSLISYIVFTTGGTFKFLQGHGYYNILAKAFLNGHTYDESLFPFGDDSHYNGKNYLYWGPVPAIIYSVIYSSPMKVLEIFSEMDYKYRHHEISAAQ